MLDPALGKRGNAARQHKGLRERAPRPSPLNPRKKAVSGVLEKRENSHQSIRRRLRPGPTRRVTRPRVMSIGIPLAELRD